jgi:hypothetical protein
MRAVQALTDITINDVNYKSCLSHNLRRLLEELGDVSAPDSNVADKSQQSSYGSTLNYTVGRGGVVYRSHPAKAPPIKDSSQSASAKSGDMAVNGNNFSLSTHVLQGGSYQGGSPMSYCATMSPSPPAVYTVFSRRNLELMNNGMAIQHTVPVFSSAPPSPSNNSYMSSPLQQVGVGMTGEKGFFNTYVDYGNTSPYPNWSTPSPITMTRDIIVEGICHMLTPTSNYYPSPVMGSRHPVSFPLNMNAGTKVVFGGSGYNTFPMQANYNRLMTPEASMKPAPTPSGSAGSTTKSSRSIINSLRSKQITEGIMNVKKDSTP